jgi:hypothetical protein
VLINEQPEAWAIEGKTSMNRLFAGIALTLVLTVTGASAAELDVKINALTPMVR